MDKGYKQFTEKGTQKNLFHNKHMKGWSYLLVMRKMQIKIIMQFHCMPNKLGKNCYIMPSISTARTDCSQEFLNQSAYYRDDHCIEQIFELALIK